MLLLVRTGGFPIRVESYSLVICVGEEVSIF